MCYIYEQSNGMYSRSFISYKYYKTLEGATWLSSPFDV